MDSLIDRSIGIDFIASLMNENCSIYRAPMEVFDDVLDELTGELIATNNDTVLYSGPCIISTILTHDKEYFDGDMAKYINVYRMIVPIEGTESIRVGDEVVIDGYFADPGVDGMTLRIVTVDATTHRVFRRVLVGNIADAHRTLIHNG